ncbi:DUF397 domain-containing protein [Streptomyces sp. NPDC005078]|uniref:DUF397 domain-containing protein n=1 Tax=unclassified Streptomyces TaxID=2593676 RepID=UPI0033AC4BEA
MGSLPESASPRAATAVEAGGECVEIAAGPGTVHVRDSKDTAGPVLSSASGGWGLRGLRRAGLTVYRPLAPPQRYSGGGAFPKRSWSAVIRHGDVSLRRRPAGGSTSAYLRYC